LAATRRPTTDLDTSDVHWKFCIVMAPFPERVPLTDAR
jgi:hypothetical protein